MPASSRRQESPATMFRRPASKQGRIRRWQSAAVNWLNGLPVTQEEFDSSSIKQELQGSTRERRSTMESIRFHANPRNWLKTQRQQRQQQQQLLRESPKNTLQQTDPLALTNLPVTKERSPARIIQLPPEPTAFNTWTGKKDDTHSTSISNEIRTAKYTVLNFLPKNILEQMRRVANIYFVFIVFLQCFSAVSNYNPFLAAMPVVAIMAATAIKDAVEDWRRHQQDNEVNYSTCLTLNRPESELLIPRYTRYQRYTRNFKRWWGKFIMFSVKLYNNFRKKSVELDGGKHRKLEKLPEGVVGWRETFWRDIRVGDIVLLRNNEMIPADIMILSTSEPDGVCFVETKNLDGETNLKIRRSPYETEWVRDPESAYNLKATIEVELPNSNLYSFHGKIIISKDVPSPIKIMDDEGVEEEGRNNEITYAGVNSSESLIKDNNALRHPCFGQSATAFLEPTVVPVNNDGLLLRGCILRNTEYVVGVAVYTGPHTKLMLNSGGTPSKRTRIERQMNPQIILNFLLLFVICVSCAVVQAQFSAASEDGDAPYWVSAFQDGIFTSSAFLGFLTFWSSLILFQTLVPISMYVTVEMVKTIQAFFINNDTQMFHLETNRRAVPRAWNLADDLGIRKDKTGTLTQNVMEFRRCSIDGHVYGLMPGQAGGLATARTGLGIISRDSPELQTSTSGGAASSLAESSEKQWSEIESSMVGKLQEILSYSYIPPSRFSFVDPNLYQDIEQNPQRRDKILQFFLLLIVCHTVLIDRRPAVEDGDEVAQLKNSVDEFKPHNLLFKAQSPDEAALVGAARDLGFVFMGRDKDLIFISVMGEFEAIKVLNVLEFSSDRKRMSTIVRRQNGSILLLSKGADNIIFERLSSESLNSDAARLTQNHLELFAEDGLRTLCMAVKELKEDEYDNWMRNYSEASTAMHNRELLLDAISDEIERDMTLLGATAIEDRLQEGVPECIETLQQAGIKIWVLTGDKLETAVNIGFSCRLLNKNMVLLVIRGVDQEETLKQLRAAYEKIWSRYFCFGDVSGGEQQVVARGEVVSFAMIIEGSTLKFALDKSCRKLFINLSSRCDAVVCCRVSPLQKAKVVELVRRGKNVMTMAIGDGANDVSMIQAADVGVGIAGQEGMQAVMSSDYAIAQFRYLTRLLLVHGRWSYLRVAQVTLSSLYKNLAFVVLLFWYQFYCGFTAQYIYDYMYLLFFNVFFSILPLLMLGSFDRDLSDSYLMKVAPIYRMGIRQTSYSMKLFLYYLLDALYQSVVCFFIPLLAYQDTAITWTGQPENQTLLGNVMALSIITCTNLYMAMCMYSWVTVSWWALILTITTLFGFVLVYGLIPSEMLYGTWRNFLDPIFWGAMILSIVLALTPRYIFKYVQTILKPTDLDIVREVSKWHLGEADLMRTLIRKDQNSIKRLGGVNDNVIATPPKAVVRSTPRKLLGMDLNDELLFPYFDATPDLSSMEPKRLEAAPKTRNRFLQRSLALFNLRTGHFERMRGYAFSQEDGMGEVLTPRRNRPQAFGSVFLGESALEAFQKVPPLSSIPMAKSQTAGERDGLLKEANPSNPPNPSSPPNPSNLYHTAAHPRIANNTVRSPNSPLASPPATIPP